MIPSIVAIPIKPFGVAKQRLAPVLDAKQRSVLGRAVAARTASIVAESGALPVVVTGDDGVARWAKGLHLDVLPEGNDGSTGLDRAAATVTKAAHGGSWAIVHADLPISTADDFRSVWARLDTASAAIAPAHDAGTNVIAGSGSARFGYGPGSFARHLAITPKASVVVRQGLAYDLDTPADLAFMGRLAAGSWLRSLLDVVEASPASR